MFKIKIAESVPGDTMTGWLEQEKGGKFGGKMGKWVKLFFVINGNTVSSYENDQQDGDPTYQIKVSDCAVRLPKSERKGRPWVFRIDTSTKDKLMVDPADQSGRERWIIALGNAGANVPGDYAAKIDKEQASKLAKRGEKKGWLNMKTPLGWKPHWCEYTMPTLTTHERPGADAKMTLDMSKLELQVGAAVVTDLGGRENSFRTTQRDPANPVSVPWSGLATDSAPEYESWVLTLSTRAVPLTKTAVENFGLELDDHGVVTDLNFEPDGEPGPAELSQVRIQQKVVEVNGVAVSSKAEIMAVLHPERLVGGLDKAVFTFEGVGEPPIGEDESEEDYLARLAAEEEARMQAEMEDEEAMAARAEQELRERLEAEAAAEAQRLKDEEERLAREEAEFQEGFGRIMQLSQSFTGKEAVGTAKMLSSDLSRRLYKEGMLSAKKDEKKREEMERGIGRSYYFLFSDMLITCKRKEKGNKLGKLGGKGMSKLGGSARSSVSVQYEGYEIETVYDTTDLKSARIISHAYHADETERSGIQIMLPDMPMLYAVSVDDALQWARAFKRVVFGLLGEDPRAAYVTHHTLCEGTLFSAAMTGNLATVKQAIALDPESAAAVDEYGATALMMAANKGHITVVLPILSTGQADVNASDAEGNTAGHLAAHGCHTDVLDILGTYEFNFNKPNKQDEVPLGILIKQGAMDAAQTSVSKGAVADRVDRSGRSGLHNAVMAGSVDEVKRWLQVGANPDKPVADRSRQTPLLLASMLTAAAGCAATTQALLDGGANPNKPGDRTGTVVLQALLDGGKLLAAEACVRAGGRYKALSGVAGDTKARFEQLSQEYVAEKKRADEVAASLAEVGGAVALTNDSSCVMAAVINVKGSRWSPKFFVLTRRQEGGLQLSRFANDVATQPEHVATIVPAAAAVEFGSGQPSVDDFGLDLFGVGEAATSGLGLAGKIAKMAATPDEEGLYKFAFASSADRQAWLKAFQGEGLGVNLDAARTAAADAKRTSALMAGGGGASGGGGGGGAASTAQLMGDAKAQVTDNIQQLSELSDRTQEMEQASGDFAAMARQLRQQKEKQSKGFGVF